MRIIGVYQCMAYVDTHLTVCGTLLVCYNW